MQYKSIIGKITLSAVTLIVFSYATAVWSHEWMAPKEDAQVKNPISKVPSSLTNGKESFLDNCAACHGDNGKGMSKDDTGLNKNTPDLGKRLQSHSDGDFFWKIQNGRGDMPGFKEVLSEEEIWEIILHIRETNK